MTIKIITLKVLAPCNEDKSLEVVLHPRCLSCIRFQVYLVQPILLHEDETIPTIVALFEKLLVSLSIKGKYGYNNSFLKGNQHEKFLKKETSNQTRLILSELRAYLFEFIAIFSVDFCCKNSTKTAFRQRSTRNIKTANELNPAKSKLIRKFNQKIIIVSN